MFESYYELNENPFRLSADENFRFAHKNYLKAWSYLSYALEQGEGFVMITGQPGCGKTTLIRDILSQLDSSKTLAINLVTNQLQAEELLRKVALEYGLPAETYNKATLLTHIEEFVEKEYENGRRAIIVIDEAQNLTLNGLEELRLLSNLQSGSHPLFQVFLVGLDELRGVILNPQMEQVRQRLIASCQIEPMSVSQTEGYIDHRLGIVGWNGDPELESSIFPLMHYITKGIPRKINHMASRLLLYGALEEKHKFTDDDVWIVAEELFGEERLSLKSGETFENFKASYSIENELQEGEQESELLKEEGQSDSAATETSDLEDVNEGVPEVVDQSSEQSSIISEVPDADELESIQLMQEHSTDIEQSNSFVEEDTSQLFPESTTYISTDEVEDLTSKIVDANRFVADELAVEARVDAQKMDVLSDESDDTVRRWTPDVEAGQDFTLEADEILNTPTMRAERHRHEIEATGGLIVSDDVVDKDEVFSGGLARSIRNIVLIVLVGFPLIGYFVLSQEQINQYFSDLNSSIQAMLTPKSKPYQSEVVAQPTEKEVKTESSEQTKSTQSVQNQTEEKIADDLSPAVKDAGEDYIATQSKYEQVVVNETRPPPIVETVKERTFQVFFELNNTEIPEEFKEMLNDLYIVLSLNEQASLKISGYADADPSDDPLQNMRLSLERAQTVSSYFLERGIEQSRIQIEGHSPSNVSSNSAQDALEKHLGNKRVELVLRDGLN
ncbi:MAG: AAA family ATPase [Candidatus Thiodiazotropha sp. L084R]